MTGSVFCGKIVRAFLVAGIMGTLAAGSGYAETRPPAPETAARQGVSISSAMTQEKVLKSGDGRVTVAVTLTAPDAIQNAPVSPPAADLVVVLDRSGSMSGQKIEDAKNAISRLLDQLGPEDRLGLVVYDDRVQTLSPLVSVTGGHYQTLRHLVSTIQPGGSTDLGGGLAQGIHLMNDYPDSRRQRKVMLVSDGHANCGITDPAALGRMASSAVENQFSVSTLGVGLQFNELLMTTIADHGAGTYHFLEDPASFARIFESELFASREVAMSDVRIQIPVMPGIQVISASGYPLRHENDGTVFFPGDLRSGQSRTFYITFQVPTAVEQTIDLGRIQVRFSKDSTPQTLSLPASLTVTCVADPAAVMASIRKEAWGDKVVREDFGQLKAEVAEDIRKGMKAQAKQRIQEYAEKQAAINVVVQSEAVTRNLSVDVRALDADVDQTFTGTPAKVAQQQQQTSKTLQHESYQQLRDKK
ncbi:VWA domain-containing protein [Desulfosarcina sp. OttesenSCG-928-B08]|nr:VWA domain-containing protein [Desulfosarcina sp. OttesenSCG-928-B08]